MTKNNLDYRVCQLEKRFDESDDKLEKIMTNHLPHLKQDILILSGKIDSLKARIGVLSVINIGAIILGLLVGKII